MKGISSTSLTTMGLSNFLSQCLSCRVIGKVPLAQINLGGYVVNQGLTTTWL